VKKCDIARQAIDGTIIERMRFAYCVNKARDTHSEYVILIAFHYKMVTQTSLFIMLYVHCLSCCCQ